MLNHLDAEDVAQNALLKLLNNPQSIPARVKSAWIWSVVRNAISDFYRQVATERKYLDSSVCEFHEGIYIAPAKSPLQRMESDPFLSQQIENAINSLSDLLRESLVMHLGGYNYCEIADRTNVSIGTVKSRLHHAKRKAQASLIAYR
jgi:RNA polymerase sigma-70 factor (ECF subfamily)